MREGIRHDVALTLPLQPVVTNGGRRLHCGLDVARFDEPPLLFRMVRPYASEAIGLQFHTHLKLVGLDFVPSDPGLPEPGEAPRAGSARMTDLMRDHIMAQARDCPFNRLR
jgi:hypothetical protein